MKVPAVQRAEVSDGGEKSQEAGWTHRAAVALERRHPASFKVGGDSICSEQTYRNRGARNDHKLLTSNCSLSSSVLFRSNPHMHKGMSGSCSHWDRTKVNQILRSENVVWRVSSKAGDKCTGSWRPPRNSGLIADPHF